MCILCLNDGVPKVRYFSVESVKNANAAGIHESIQNAFDRFGITKFEDRIVGLNADGASVNMGPLNGLGKIVKDSALSLELVHCQGRIQAHFEIGNRFWAHKNWRPNFDRSTKDIILILFNSR